MNRFNQLLNYGEYVPLVQPLPYDALAKFGETVKQEADANLQSSVALKELSRNIKRDPEDEAFYKEFDAEYAPRFEQLAELARTDSPEFKKEYYLLKSDFTSDPRRNIFEVNYETGKAARTSAQQMHSTGKWSPLGWSDGFTTPARKRDKLDYINFQGHDPWTPYYTDANKAVAGIPTHTLVDKKGRPIGGFEYLDMEPNTGRLIIRKAGTVEGVTDVHTTATVMNAITGFLEGTDGGRSLYKDTVAELASKGITDPDKLHQAAVVKAFNVLKQEADKQKYVKYGASGFSFVPDGGDGDSEGGDYEYGIGTGASIGDKIKNEYSTYYENSLLQNIGNLVGIESEPKQISQKTQPFEYTVNKRLGERAVKALGRGSADDNATKEEYIDAFVNSESVQIYRLNTDSEYLNKLNSRLFTRGQSAYQGDFINTESNTAFSGKDFYKNFVNNDKYNVTTSAELGLINPYGIPYAAEILVKNKDDNTLGTFVSVNPFKNAASKTVSPEEVLISKWGVSAFHPSTIKSTITKEKTENGKTVRFEEEILVEFERDTDRALDDNGAPVFLDSGTAKIYDKKGNFIAESDPGLQPEKAFRNLMSKLRTK